MALHSAPVFLARWRWEGKSFVCMYVFLGGEHAPSVNDLPGKRCRLFCLSCWLGLMLRGREIEVLCV